MSVQTEKHGGGRGGDGGGSRRGVCVCESVYVKETLSPWVYEVVPTSSSKQVRKASLTHNGAGIGGKAGARNYKMFFGDAIC